MKVKEIDIQDEDYPRILREIKSPPSKLYFMGNKELLKTKGIAIVGSRKCTEKGKINSRMFAANIAKAGFTVISGMAEGIDAAAHIGALDVNGATIAVLGNGPKVIFPPENNEIYNNILKNGGLIISEYPSDTPPVSDRFRSRNRIVSRVKYRSFNC